MRLIYKDVELLITSVASLVAIVFGQFKCLLFILSISLHNGQTSTLAIIGAGLIDWFTHFGVGNLKAHINSRRVVRLMSNFPDLAYRKIPISAWAHLFELDELPPFGGAGSLRQRMQEAFNNVIVFERPEALRQRIKRPAGYVSYTSGVGVMSYILLGDRIDKLTRSGVFFLIHELGHLSKVGTAGHRQLDRRMASVVFLTMLSTILIVSASDAQNNEQKNFYLVLYIFLACIFWQITELICIRQKAYYFAEVAADWVACRQISSGFAKTLIEYNFSAPSDNRLTVGENAKRKVLLLAGLRGAANKIYVEIDPSYWKFVVGLGLSDGVLTLIIVAVGLTEIVPASLFVENITKVSLLFLIGYIFIFLIALKWRKSVNERLTWGE